MKLQRIRYTEAFLPCRKSANCFAISFKNYKFIGLLSNCYILLLSYRIMISERILVLLLVCYWWISNLLLSQLYQESKSCNFQLLILTGTRNLKQLNLWMTDIRHFGMSYLSEYLSTYISYKKTFKVMHMTDARDSLSFRWHTWFCK